MHLFKRDQPLNFSGPQIQSLGEIIDSLATTLRDAGLSFYINQLHQIKSAAANEDEETFKKLVISHELFGGSGALWEVYISDAELQNIFYHQFRHFVIQLQVMGIRNQRINQTKKFFDQITKK